MATETDLRVLVPRVRRAVEGIGQPETLTDDQVKDLAADAASEVVLYTGSLFGKALLIVERDATGGYPTEYATSDELSLAEGSVVAIQAALNSLWHQLSALKTSETIRDEAGEWSYTISAQAMRDRFKQLVEERDRALESVAQGQVTSFFINTLAVRDAQTAAAIEPFAAGLGAGGQEIDYRFGG